MTMKMKRLKYLFPAALTALLAAGCSDQAVEQPDVPAVEETATEITVTATMTVDKRPGHADRRQASRGGFARVRRHTRRRTDGECV